MEEKQKDTCRSCQGSGKCARCGGAGNVISNTPEPITVISGQVRSGTRSSRTCSRCYGSGLCQVCKGSGKAS